jgi:hypothetical protein
LQDSEKKNEKEIDFLEKAASKMSSNWVYPTRSFDDKALLTTSYKSNYELKYEIRKNKKVPKSHFLDSAFWAAEVIKYL